jgi:hypothetical protein
MIFLHNKSAQFAHYIPVPNLVHLALTGIERNTLL